MSDYDDRLLIKPKSSAESGSQRMMKTRATQGKKSNPTGAERQARRSGRTRQRVEKEREDARVCRVSKRAGGFSQARKENVRAGQRKNKDTAVFSRQACSPLIQLSFGFASDIDQTNINRDIRDGNWLSSFLGGRTQDQEDHRGQLHRGASH